MEAEHTIFIVLATLPIALIILGISVVKKKIFVGRLLGTGIIVISTIFSILYIQLYLCSRPGHFCELIGFLYYLLIIEAVILILLFFGLGRIVQKRLR